MISILQYVQTCTFVVPCLFLLPLPPHHPLPIPPFPTSPPPPPPAPGSKLVFAASPGTVIYAAPQLKIMIFCS